MKIILSNIFNNKIIPGKNFPDYSINDINNISENLTSYIRLFADDCIMYRPIISITPSPERSGQSL